MLCFEGLKHCNKINQNFTAPFNFLYGFIYHQILLANAYAFLGLHTKNFPDAGNCSSSARVFRKCRTSNKVNVHNKKRTF